MCVCKRPVFIIHIDLTQYIYIYIYNYYRCARLLLLFFFFNSQILNRTATNSCSSASSVVGAPARRRFVPRTDREKSIVATATMEYGLEPLQRARSNTWPLPRPDAEDAGPQLPDGSPPQQLLDMVNGIGACDGGTLVGGGGPSSSSSSSSGLHPPPPPPLQQQQSSSSAQQQPSAQQQQSAQATGSMVAGPVKKTSSRRNAWGNQSYADLITQAIGSVPEQRLTLSQIYEWMVQNVPYFKDKGDSNSSAGWKVSFLPRLPSSYHLPTRSRHYYYYVLPSAVPKSTGSPSPPMVKFVFIDSTTEETQGTCVCFTVEGSHRENTIAQFPFAMSSRWFFFLDVIFVHVR